MARQSGLEPVSIVIWEQLVIGREPVEIVLQRPNIPSCGLLIAIGFGHIVMVEFHVPVEPGHLPTQLGQVVIDSGSVQIGLKNDYLFQLNQLMV